MKEDDDYLICKVVFIGEAGVGKTSIIQRFIKKTFSSSTSSTTGAIFIEKEMYFEDINQKIKFELWDTAGQEKYRALAKVFYNNASICIMVYDITSKKTFDGLKNYWAENIKSNISGNSCKLKKYNLIQYK